MYRTLDYGDNPFRVDVDDTSVTVYHNYDLIRVGDVWEDMEKTKIYEIQSYDTIFIGQDESGNKKKNEGNSILVKYPVESDNMYVYIGNRIYSFKAFDKILSYHSPVGNSGVPYSYAVGEKYTYLMLDPVYISNDDLEPGDPYEHFYHINKPKNAKNLTNYFKKFDIDVIQDRLYYNCAHK